MLGWVHSLSQEDPPLSQRTRQKYVVGLCRLLTDLASQGQPLRPGLILPEDFPIQPPTLKLQRKTIYRLAELRFGAIFDTRIQILATTLRPSTVGHYRTVICHFLDYLKKHLLAMRSAFTCDVP
jgi:hypothetical protein